MMRQRRGTMLMALAAMLGSQAVLTLGDDPPELPDDRSIRYNVREDLCDPDSTVIWTIVLAMTAEEVDGSSVAWSVESIVIDQLDTNGDTLARWIDSSPVMSTADSLWWIEHADPTEPELSEFALPPLMARIAAPEFGSEYEVEYSLEGVPHVPPEPMEEYVTAGVDLHVLWVSMYYLLQIWEEEGPVVIDDPEDPVMQ